MRKTTADTISHTIVLWTELPGKMMSHEDARQAVENITGFFRILLEWEEAEQKLAKKQVEPRASTSTSKSFNLK